MKPGEIIKTFITKKGSQVLIRRLKWEDLDSLLAYVNALVAEDTYVQMSGRAVTREEELHYLTDSLIKMEQNQKIHLIVEVNGKFAGSAEIRRHERRQSHMGDIGISIVKPHREEGIGTVLFETLIAEGRKLGLTLLTLTCFANNQRAIHVYEKLGFQRAGLIPKAFKYKDNYVDELIMYLPLDKS